MKAVSNAGPLIHLDEIKALKALEIFTRVAIPPAVDKETSKIKKTRINVVQLSGEAKNLAKMLMIEYNIDLGEAEAIALAASTGTKTFLTDDLAARDAAKTQGLEPHGTLGIITRALREGIISKAEAIEKIEELHKNSTLFLTKDLIDWIKEEIEKSKK